jgi:hypothetical protein
MDDETRRTLESIEKANASLPPEGPVVLSAEYLRLIERVEALPENRPGTDKSWTERVLTSWKRALKTVREVPPA